MTGPPRVDRPKLLTAAGRIYYLDTAEHFTIGRSPSDITLVDGLVAPRHARITHAVSGYFIEPLGAPISINGRLVAGSTGLRSGDELRVGNTVLTVEGMLTPMQSSSAAGALARSAAPLSVSASLQSRRFAIGALVGLAAASLFWSVTNIGGVPGGAAIAPTALGLPVAIVQPTPTPSPTPTPRLTTTEVARMGRLGTVLIRQGNGFGSGIYLGREHVLTAAHVVAARGAISVTSDSKVFTSVLVVSMDKVADLALLRVAGLDASASVALRLGDSRLLQVGDPLVAIGFPAGVGLTATTGIVSGLRRLGSTELVQTEAALNPGNSGGPVLDQEGAVIGVADFNFPAYPGLNFAVASSTAREFLTAAGFVG